MKHDCSDCGAIASVYWFVVQPQIWKCSVCGTLLHPQELQRVDLNVSGAANEQDSFQPALPG